MFIEVTLEEGQTFININHIIGIGGVRDGSKCNITMIDCDKSLYVKESRAEVLSLIACHTRIARKSDIEEPTP